MLKLDVAMAAAMTTHRPHHPAKVAPRRMEGTSGDPITILDSARDR